LSETFRKESLGGWDHDQDGFAASRMCAFRARDGGRGMSHGLKLKACALNLRHLELQRYGECLGREAPVNQLKCGSVICGWGNRGHCVT
jgi:hypothetical protein